MRGRILYLFLGIVLILIFSVQILNGEVVDERINNKIKIGIRDSRKYLLYKENRRAGNEL